MKPSKLKKTSLWILILLYTTSLHQAIFVYRGITREIAPNQVHLIPPLIILLFFVAYMGVAYMKNRTRTALLYLIPCALITIFITLLESNANKYIHLPEFTLMAWMVFEALKNELDGKELLFLVFINSTLLGVTDEIIQGIHPYRFYGLKDMVINSMGVLIGILTIAGLIEHPSRQVEPRAKSLRWGHLIKAHPFQNLILSSGFIVTGIALFALKNLARGTNHFSAYPRWLLLCHVLFLASAAWAIGTTVKEGGERRYPERKSFSSFLSKRESRRWRVSLISAMAIIAAINALIVVGALCHCSFR